MPNTTDIEKTISANRIKPHSDRVGMVGEPKEQGEGAVPALLLVKLHAVAEKEAVNGMGRPFAVMVTPVKV